MRFPSREQIAALRERYPHGTKVELLSMDDPQAPPTGTMGEVLGVDDAGQILVRWEQARHWVLSPAWTPSASCRKAVNHEREGFRTDHGHP